MAYIGAGITRFNTADELTVTGDAELKDGLTVDTNTLVVDADNNRVGIGTSSPDRKLAIGDYTGTEFLRFQSVNTGYAAIEFGDPEDGDVGEIKYDHTDNYMWFRTSGLERMRLTSGGNLQFNSGYGSVATAYGCRAWVNFEGNATPVAIRASGNVSSITDGGVGDYRVNFTTALPDANYSCVASHRQTGGVLVANNADISTTSVKISSRDDAGNVVDPSHVCVAVFR